MVNEGNGELRGHEFTGMWIERLDQLVEVLERGFEEGGWERRKGRGGVEAS